MFRRFFDPHRFGPFQPATPWGSPPWGPPHGHGHRHHGHDHPHHGPFHHRRRPQEEGFPFFGPPFGRGRGGFGPGPGRFFDRGDLKYVILDLLKDQPRHGYDVIRALEDDFAGFYNPSPGSVYPTLQLLEDQGYLTSSQLDGKRVYAITDAGRAFLAERSAQVEALRARIAERRGFGQQPEAGELFGEMRQLGALLFRLGSSGAFQDPERLRRLREVVARARREIEAIVGDEQPASPKAASGETWPPDLV